MFAANHRPILEREQSALGKTNMRIRGCTSTPSAFDRRTAGVERERRSVDRDPSRRGGRRSPRRSTARAPTPGGRTRRRRARTARTAGRDRAGSGPGPSSRTVSSADPSAARRRDRDPARPPVRGRARSRPGSRAPRQRVAIAAHERVIDCGAARPGRHPSAVVSADDPAHHLVEVDRRPPASRRRRPARAPADRRPAAPAGAASRCSSSSTSGSAP